MASYGFVNVPAPYKSAIVQQPNVEIILRQMSCFIQRSRAIRLVGSAERIVGWCRVREEFENRV
jgi:hypothetical protein